MWWFNVTVYDRFVSNLKSDEYKDLVNVDEIPDFLITGIQRYIDNIKNLRNKSIMISLSSTENDIFTRINQNLLDVLLPYQLEGIQFIINRGGRGLIGDEMGCGKTIQAIGCMQYYRNHWPVLILVPPSLAFQWQKELLIYCKGVLTEDNIRIITKATGDSVKYGKVTIIPYTMLEKLGQLNKISTSQFGVVIADESQNLKNRAAKRTTMALPFLKKASVAICLTGTPALNRPAELYTQLHGLIPNVFNDYDAFARRYCNRKMAQFNNGATYDDRGSSNEIELKLLLENLVMIRRLKSQVLSDELIGEKLREVRYVTPDPTLMTEVHRLDKQKKSLNAELNNPLLDESKKYKIQNDILQLGNYQYQLAGIVKIKQVLQEISKLLQLAYKNKDIEINLRKEVLEMESAKLEEDNIRNNAAVTVSYTNRDYQSILNDNISEDEEDEIREDEVREDEVRSPLSLVKAVNNNSPVIMNLESDILGEDDERNVENATINNNSAVVIVDDCSDDLVDTDCESDVLYNSTLHKLHRKRKVNELIDEEERACCSSNNKTHSMRRSGSATTSATVEVLDLEDEDEDDEDMFFDKITADRHKKSSSTYGAATMNGNKTSNVKPAECFEVFKDSGKRVNLKKSSKARKECIDEMEEIDDYKDDNKIEPGFVAGKQLVTYTKDNVEAGALRKIIVFAHHKEVMDKLEDGFRDMNVGFIRIDGEITQSVRNRCVKAFQEDDVTKIALLSITAAGTGLNLTRANVILFAELSYSPGIVVQCEGRCHRLGQTSKQVRIIYVLAKGTEDERVWDMVRFIFTLMFYFYTILFVDSKQTCSIGCNCWNFFQ